MATKLYGTYAVAGMFGVRHGTVAEWVRKGKLVPDYVTDTGHSLFSAGTLWSLRRNGFPLITRRVTPYLRKMDKDTFDRHYPDRA